MSDEARELDRLGAGYAAGWRDALAQPTAALFQSGAFALHSGELSNWRIDCDALTDADIETLALVVAEGVGDFGTVEGVPKGGLRLAKALEVYAQGGSLLIVDDVLTTGASMEEQRAGREAVGAVIFARGECPAWVTPLFSSMPTAAREAAAVQALRALTEDDPAYSSHQEPEDARPGDACLLCDLDNLSPAAAALLAQGEMVWRLEWLVAELRTHIRMEGHGSFVHGPGCHLCHAFTRTTDDAVRARVALAPREEKDG